MEDKNKLITELKAENERLKEENSNFEEIVKLCRCEQYKQTLQEIRAIAENNLCSNCVIHKRECNCQCLADEILQKITKAESNTEIRQKIVEVQLLELPKKESDRYYAKELRNAVIDALEWVLREDNQ